MKLILFSGGFDSVYTLQKLMKEFHNSNNNERIEIISIEASFSGHKTEREIESRKKIINYLKSKYYRCNISESILKIDTCKFNFNRVGLAQPLFWLPAICMAVPDNEDSEIIFSYILGDQTPIFRDNIISIIRNSIALNETIDNENPKNDVKISFPTILTPKSEIISDLINNDEWLFRECTTCEEPFEDEDNCGLCTPCTHLKETLMTLIMDSTQCKHVKDVCVETLKERFDINAENFLKDLVMNSHI